MLAVYGVPGAVKFQIIVQGGIETTSDALEFLMASESAVSIGTANFTDPQIPERIVDELVLYALQERNLRTLAQIVGRADVGSQNAYRYRRR